MRLRGLYIITATCDSTEILGRQVEQALCGGARLVQYRNKSVDARRRRADAAALVGLTRRYGVPLIVNDDVELALEVGANGVHLGRDDPDPAAARRRLGADRLIGVSCYDRFERAVTAVESGADYVAFGSFYPSPTKPQAVTADPQLLYRARRELAVPTVAIGGITPENGGSLVAAGADMLAVISAVFGRPDIRAAARRFADLYQAPEDIAP